MVGLAPAAHGGNRTGRVFTGDRSGDWLYSALFRAGLANQPESVSRDDGLRLRGAYVTAVNRCPPPQNRPTTEERDNCLPYLVRELRLLRSARVVVALGSYAWTVRHGAEARLETVEGRRRREWAMVGCFHPSQQNTFTGRLTEPMLDEVFARAGALASG